ncbi:MAG: hypothetical protein MIO92_01360 [Methanosarcinaceae archaeon]|nr:hypothetical protein [Methanosarcinaceae archaeon]
MPERMIATIDRNLHQVFGVEESSQVDLISTGLIRNISKPIVVDKKTLDRSLALLLSRTLD